MLVHQIVSGSGGAERSALALAGELVKRRHRVTVCVTRDIESSFRVALQDSGVEVMELGRTRKLDLRAFAPLRRLLGAGEVDVLHSHMFGSNVWGALFGTVHRVPAVVAHEHTWSYEGQYHRVALDFLIGRAVDAYVSVSNADAQRMVSREHIPADKITVIPNAYVPREGQASGDLRAELGLETSTPLVGTLAQLRPQKALHVLLEAHALLEVEPSPHLAIAGDGECRGELEVRANQLGIASQVHFLGVRDDIEALLAAFDAFSLSSDFEGTPLSVVESMSLGTPVVATRVGGLPDQIEDGRSGLLVPPRDPDALAAALDRVLSDDALRERLGDAAREVAADWSMERTADRFVALYRSLLEQPAR